MSSLLHPWDLSPQEAIHTQSSLSNKIILQPLKQKPLLIGGADISFNKNSETVYAGIIVLRLSDMTEVCRAVITSETKFPYIPGLLSFREVPSLLEAWEKLEVKPDVMVLDGQGIAHPRRLGIASHFGLLTDVPSIGCAKSLLTGKFEEPGSEAGATSPIYDRTEVIGLALRTRKKIKPVFISPGHKITGEESLELIKGCITSYRIPEPTRRAHLLVNQARRAGSPDRTQYSLF